MAQDNVIEVLIVGVDQLSKQVAAGQTSLLGLQRQLDSSTRSTAQFNTQTLATGRASDNLRRSIMPVASAMQQLSLLASQLAPDFRLVITSMDNITFAMVRAGAQGATFGQSLLLAFRAAFNPITLLVLGATAIIGGFVMKLISARQEKEKFDTAMRTGDVAFFSGKVIEAQREVDRLAQKMVELQNLKPTLPGGTFGAAEQAELDRLKRAGLTKEQIDAAKKKAEADKNLAEAEQKRATESTQGLLDELRAQQSLIGVEGDRLDLQKAENAIQALRQKNLDPALMKELEMMIRLNTAKEISAKHTAALKAIEQARIGDIVAQFDEMEKQEEDIFAPDFENKVAEAMIKGNLKILESIRDTVKQSGEQWDEMQEDALETANALEIIFSRMRDKQKERDEQLDREEMDRLFGIADLIERAKQEQEQAAGEMARSFTDKFIAIMDGGKFELVNVMRNLGRTIMTEFVEEALKTLIKQAGIAGKGTIGGGILQFLLSLFGGGGFPDLGAFAFSGGEVLGKGGYLSGNFMPVGTLRKFQTGGVARGPTLGVIGEEGPEIVARMKPAGAGDFGGAPTIIINGDITPRRPTLNPRDVIEIVSDNMHRGGKTAKMAANVIRRGGRV